MVSIMKKAPKRTTVRLDEHLLRALKVKAVETDRSVSDIVDEAVRLLLAEDAEDLAAFEARKNEPSLDFDEVMKDMRRRGRL